MTPREPSTAISPVIASFIAFAAFYAAGFITWLLPFAIQSGLGWTKIRTEDRNLIRDLILKELKIIYGTEDFEKNLGWASWLSAKIAEISDSETYYSAVERNTMMWNLQLTLSGSFGTWSIALLVASFMADDSAAKGTFAGVAILLAIFAFGLFRYTKGMYHDIRSSKGMMFLALRGVNSDKLTAD